MKLTYEQKVNAYKEWKEEYKSLGQIALELNANSTAVKYFIKLADRHGVEILKHDKNKYYSLQEKERIINRVLIGNESVFAASINEGLSSQGLLPAWIKSYKENGYTVVEKKRGRKLMAKKKTIEELQQENKELKKKALKLEIENLYLKN